MILHTGAGKTPVPGSRMVFTCLKGQETITKTGTQHTLIVTANIRSDSANLKNDYKMIPDYQTIMLPLLKLTSDNENS